MPWEYYYENHDWDMTLKAASTLLILGAAQAVSDDRSVEYSCFTGSMLLSFNSVESFTNSIAFCVSRENSILPLDYPRYLKEKTFWGRVDAVCNQAGVSTERRIEPFSTIEKMRQWRNALVHASPFAVEPTIVESPEKVAALEPRLARLDYAKGVDALNANAFYKAAYAYVSLLRVASGVEPRAYVSYRELASEKTVRIERAAERLDPNGAAG